MKRRIVESWRTGVASGLRPNMSLPAGAAAGPGVGNYIPRRAPLHGAAAVPRLAPAGSKGPSHPSTASPGRKPRVANGRIIRELFMKKRLRHPCEACGSGLCFLDRSPAVRLRAGSGPGSRPPSPARGIAGAPRRRGWTATSEVRRCGPPAIWKPRNREPLGPSPQKGAAGSMSHDTWIHRAVRAGIRPLVGTAVRPNHLTSLRLARGMGAAGVLASGSAAWVPSGAGLLLASHASGPRGRRAGAPVRTAQPLRTPLRSRLRRGLHRPAFSRPGRGTARRPARPMGPTPRPRGGSRGDRDSAAHPALGSPGRRGCAALSGLAGFDADDAMFLVPLPLWAGARESLLLAAAIGAPLFGLFFLGKRRRDGPRDGDGAALPGDPS